VQAPRRGAASFGIHSAALAELPIFLGTNMRLAAGGMTDIMTQLHPSDRWGEWRARVLLGATDMPRPHESRLGSEAYLVPGVARYHAKGRELVAFAPGVLFGLPIRLSGHRPPWRSDDLVAIGSYIVPWAGATSLGPTLGTRERLEINAGLSFRVQLWTAMLP
jgi:hypothetical protein